MMAKHCKKCGSTGEYVSVDAEFRKQFNNDEILDARLKNINEAMRALKISFFAHNVNPSLLERIFPKVVLIGTPFSAWSGTIGEIHV